MGGREAGGLSHTLPGHRSVANPEHRREIEEFWGIPEETISAKAGLTAVEMFEAIGKRPGHGRLDRGDEPRRLDAGR